MELSAKLEDRFGFRADRVADTLGELWALGERPVNPEAADRAAGVWNAPPSHDGPTVILAETLAEAFVRRALSATGRRGRGRQALGRAAYRKLLAAPDLLAALVGRLPDDSSASCCRPRWRADMMFFGLHLAENCR